MDIQDIVDLLCLGYPKRPSRQIEGGINEPFYAEIAAFLQFRSDFLARNRGGLVVSQLDYKNVGTPSDSNTQFILRALDVYFRNWWSPRNLSQEGGFRKPDGLGIAQGGGLIELIEVKPHDRYKEGEQQLNEMIDKIKEGLKSFYGEECARLGQSLSFNPDLTVVKGSPWKPGPEGRSIPLVPPPVKKSGTQVHAAGVVDEINWICYKPTLRQLPDGTTPVNGVILYEIHSINKPQARNVNQQQKLIPDDLARRLAEAHAQRVQTRPLQLVPWANDYVANNPADARLLKALGLVMGAVLVAVVAVAIIEAAPALIAALAESAAEEELAAETVEVLVQEGGYRDAATLVRVSVQEYEAAESSDALIEAAKRAALR